MDWMPIIKVAIAIVILSLASLSDWRSRMASDAFWIVLGTFGLTFLALQIYADGVSPLYYLFLFPLCVFFYDIYWDRPALFEKDGEELALALYISAFIVLGALIIIFQTDAYLWKLMSILVVFLIIILLYYFDIVKGGADAKALIALAILFPIYPSFGDFPLLHIPTEFIQFLFPFAILILFNAALFLMIFPISFAFYNTIRGDAKFPHMFLGYKMDISQARNKYVWAMEKVEDGERSASFFPRGEYLHEEILDELEASGAKSIWVTPKIPFLIPLTISLLFSVFVGNIFFYFMP